MTRRKNWMWCKCEEKKYESQVNYKLYISKPFPLHTFSSEKTISASLTHSIDHCID